MIIKCSQYIGIIPKKDMNPIKYLIKDLSNKPVPFDVWVQGILKRRIGNDIIISDSSGEVKVSDCDVKDINIGDYCCVIGIVENKNQMPQIKALKFIKIMNSYHQQAWEMEVKEAQLLLQGRIAPNI